MDSSRVNLNLFPFEPTVNLINNKTFTRGPIKEAAESTEQSKTFLLVLIPLSFFTSMWRIKDSRLIYIALTEISNSRVVELLPTDDNVLVKPGDVVHGSSRKITSTVRIQATKETQFCKLPKPSV